VHYFHFLFILATLCFLDSERETNQKEKGMQQFAKIKPVADRRGLLKEYRKPFTAQYGEENFCRNF